MFLGAAGLVEEVLEFVDFGVKTVVQSKASLIDGSSKSVLEFKAQLIAAKSGKQRNFGGFVIRFIKNIQPISVGV